MKYRNARDVLPEELLAALQNYVDGELVYVPSKQQQKAAWGAVNGSRERYALRNLQVMRQYMKGASLEELSRTFYLSKDSVRKIVKAHKEEDVFLQQASYN